MSDKGYTHPDLLATPEDIRGWTGRTDLRVVDTRPIHDYVAGHVPGALHVDLYGLSLNDTRPEPFRAFMWMLGYLFGARGIGADHKVVFVDADSGMRAARGFWIAEYFGHEDVHVLDGGMKAWAAAGLPMSRECPVYERATFDTGKTVPERFIGYPELLASLGREGFVPLDTRSDEEYYGTLVRAARGGAIPGAVHIEYLDNLDGKGTYKPAAELRAIYERAGVTPDKTVVAYCQGGYRSAHSYLALRLLGYGKVRNYIGSWKEWGDRTELPIEKPVR